MYRKLTVFVLAWTEDGIVGLVYARIKMHMNFCFCAGYMFSWCCPLIPHWLGTGLGGASAPSLTVGIEIFCATDFCKSVYGLARKVDFAYS